MIRLDRSRKRTDVWLGEKMIFFAVGAALGIGGMVTGHDWLIWVAIVILVIGFVLRLLDRRSDSNDSNESNESNESNDRDGPATS